MNKQRYEREIEEILQKYEEEKAAGKRPEKKPERPPFTNQRWSGPPAPSRRSSPSFNWRRISSGQYIGMALALLVLSLLFSGPIATLMGFASIVLFVLAIIQHRSGSAGYFPGEQKRWRGQVIDFNTRRDITNDPFAAIKRWFRRR